MLTTMTCDICKKKFLVRPSKYGAGYSMYDAIVFARRNTKYLDIGGGVDQLILCPEHFYEVAKLIANTYGLNHLKDRAEWWEKQVHIHE